MTELEQRRTGGQLSTLGTNPAAQLLASVPPPDDRPLMPPSRVSILLSEAAAIDQRVITELMIHEWQVALAGLEFEECATGIRLYRQSRDDRYLTPARVREQVQLIRADRAFDERVANARRQVAEAEQGKAQRPVIGPITEAQFWAEQDAEVTLHSARELIALDDRLQEATRAAVARGENPIEARRGARQRERERTVPGGW